nr:hypothetical protein [Tanacetum cinerariifolium]
MFYVYSFDETLKEFMKVEYLHDDGDVFVGYSWERDLSIEEDVYPEWCLEFFSMMYFERGVDSPHDRNEKIYNLVKIDGAMALGILVMALEILLTAS